MKKVVAIICLLIVCMAVSASASLDNWRIHIRTSASTGMYYGAYASIGVYPGASDGLDVSDAESPWIAGHDSMAWTVSELGTATYSNDLHEQSADKEEWKLRVGVGSDYPDPDEGSGESTFRMQFWTIGTTYQVVTGSPYPKYRLTLVDTKGGGEGPAWWYDGKVWDLTIPTTANTQFLELTDVPNKVVALSHAGLIGDGSPNSGGYEFKFEQIIPEPSSMLAFGASLVGLAGFAVRKRRS
ncbi:MAG TPA: PEP-CTERM sorting domain-containing protein [Armatimonadota bacterium]|nr:PEP-CTERM sorting domain-containing protein [Armatimonadota bacterium]